MFLIEGREKIDPAVVTKIAEEQNRDLFAVAGEVYDANPLAADLYGDREKYVMAVCRAKVYENRLPLGSKVEELPMELIPFSREPYYDLHELVQEVIDEQYGGTYEGISSINWTDRAYKQYYGKIYYDDMSIKINCVLNSKNVPKEAVKFVIYHELLHRDFLLHNAEFKEKEHLYPDYEHCEKFLYGNMHRFDIKEW